MLRGEFDTMTEECSQLVVENIPKAVPLVTIPRAAHCKLIDEPEACSIVIKDFLENL